MKRLWIFAVMLSIWHAAAVAQDVNEDDALILSPDIEWDATESTTAKVVSYTRDFTKTTVLGEASGWETIVLPFDVQTITEDATGKTLAPFGSGVEADKHFWLATLTADGLQSATEIKADVPYMIAMPNSPRYADESNISGAVTFSAEDATLHPADMAQTIAGGLYNLVPSYKQQAVDGAYILNDEEYKTYVPGSVFVLNGRDVRPYEAYLTLAAEAGHRAVITFDDIAADATAIQHVPGGHGAQSSAIYTLSGQRVHMGGTLTPGLYIVGGKKMIVR